MTRLVEVLDKYFHHNVLKLDVHHGSHGFLLGAHQGGPKDDTQVRNRHQVELALSGNSAGGGTCASIRVRCCSLLIVNLVVRGCTLQAINSFRPVKTI